MLLEYLLKHKIESFTVYIHSINISCKKNKIKKLDFMLNSD